jgi:HK97 gp10 family phage protein
MVSNADAAVQLNALAKDLAAASGQPFKEVASSLIAQGAAQVETYAKTYSPVRTGHNRDEINSVVNGLSATITAQSDYARFLEYGTGTRGEFPGKPIVIEARPGGVLAFKVNGKMVYAKKVTNPGMAPRPFMRPAVERVAWPVAGDLANAAVVFITHGPQAPSALPQQTNSAAQARGQADAQNLLNAGVATAKGVSTAKKAFS